MNKSLWAQYREEMSQTKFVEYEWGFFSYLLHQDVFQIEDAYVIPSERRKGRFKEILEKGKELARAAGKTKVVGCVCLINKNPTDALKCHLAAGCEPYLAEDGRIWLRVGVD